MNLVILLKYHLFPSFLCLSLVLHIPECFLMPNGPTHFFTA